MCCAGGSAGAPVDSGTCAGAVVAGLFGGSGSAGIDEVWAMPGGRLGRAGIEGVSDGPAGAVRWGGGTKRVVSSSSLLSMWLWAGSGRGGARPLARPAGPPRAAGNGRGPEAVGPGR